jgi:hypothetical protein
MGAVLLILALLVLAASLGSWLFSQWLSATPRVSALTLALGGVGFVLLIGATAAAILVTSAKWPSFVPQFLASQSEPIKATTAPVAAADFGSAEQWPATTCLKPMHATATTPRRWFIDNDCERIVAVMLAWCDEAKSPCTAGTPQAGWRYEATGIVMTNAMAKPIARRMPEHDAPIAGTYALLEPDGAKLRIRYLACYLSDTAATAVMHETIADDAFRRALLADDCYARVASSSQAGASSGQPPILSQPELAQR